METKSKVVNMAGVSMLLTPDDEAPLRSFIARQSLQSSFAAMVGTDANGLIIRFEPVGGISWDFIFFIQNLMIGQRLYLIDEVLREQGAIK